MPTVSTVVTHLTTVHFVTVPKHGDNSSDGKYFIAINAVVVHRRVGGIGRILRVAKLGRFDTI